MRFSPEEISYIVDRYKQGANLYGIAKETSRSSTTVRRILVREGVYDENRTSANRAKFKPETITERKKNRGTIITTSEQLFTRWIYRKSLMRQRSVMCW